MIGHLRPAVTIANQLLTGRALNGVRLYRGRDTVDEQARASYATVQLVSFDDELIHAAIGDTLRVTVTDSGGEPFPLFRGSVSDVEPTVVDHGEAGMETVITVTAVGPLARLHRGRIDPALFGVTNDGERIAQVLGTVYALRWNTVDAELLWEDLDPTASWDTFDAGGNVFPDVDTPGQYEIDALATTDPRQAVYDAANDGRGMLYETGDGAIGYDDESARLARIIDDGYVQIPATAIAGPGLASVSRIGELANTVEVSWSGGTETAINDASVRRYGETLVATYETRLTSATAAELRAEEFAATRADPRPSLQGVAIDIEIIDDLALRTKLVQIAPGTPVRLAGMPLTVAANSSWPGFVEAIQWELSRTTARLTLTLSDQALSVAGYIDFYSDAYDDDYDYYLQGTP